MEALVIVGFGCKLESEEFTAFAPMSFVGGTSFNVTDFWGGGVFVIVVVGGCGGLSTSDALVVISDGVVVSVDMMGVAVIAGGGV